MTQPSHGDILTAIGESREATLALTERVDALWQRSMDRDARLDNHSELLERLTDILEAWDTGKRTGQFFVGVGRVVKWTAGIVAGIAVIGAAVKYAWGAIVAGGGTP